MIQYGMWNSIKKLFTSPANDDENNKTQTQLIQDLESCKENIENQKNQINAIIRDSRRLREEKNNTELELKVFKIKEEQQITKELEDKAEFDNNKVLEEKARTDSLNKEIMKSEIGRRNEHYNNFLHFTFPEILDKKERENYKQPSTNSIILDANIILDPYNSGGDHIPLMDLLNNIDKLNKKKLIIQPILYKKLIFEYTNLYDIEDLTIFPALEMAEYFNNSIRILDTSTNIETRYNKLMDELSQPHKQQFLENSQQRNFENDILHAAIAQTCKCPLVTNDIALLRLAQNPHKNLKIFHNSIDSQYKNYPHIDTYLNDIGKNNN